ncbi:MAG: hypothetical protein AAGG08_14950, partial [Actinomycetota bacterium]
PAPIAIHRDLRLRTAFAGVNFFVVTLLIGLAYTVAADQQFRDAVAEDGPKPPPVDAADPAPSVRSVVVSDAPGGVDLVIELDDWTFAPPLPVDDEADDADDDDGGSGGSVETGTDTDSADAGSPVSGYGLIVDVDGETIARVDDGRVTIPDDDVDLDDLELILFTPDRRQVESDGERFRLELD